MASNFNSPTISSAAWLHHQAGQPVRTCRSDGYSFLRTLQSELRIILAPPSPEQPWSVGPLPSVSGVVSEIDIAAGAGWNVGTLRALYAVCRRYSSKVPAAMLSSISSDIGRVASRQPLSASTTAAALWIAYHSTGFRRTGTGPEVQVHDAGSPTEISFEANTVFPVAGTTPPLPTNGIENSLVCVVGGVVVPPPVAVAGVFERSVPLLVAMLAIGVLAVSLATKDAPKMVDIRNRSRRNPSYTREQIEEMRRCRERCEK